MSNSKSNKLKPRTQDLMGKCFGRLTVIKFVGYKPVGKKQVEHAFWLCQCRCENYRTIIGNSLTGGNSTSCGCLQKDRASQSSRAKTIDLTGQRFGRLVVLTFAGYIASETRGASAYWKCICDCGINKTIRADQLIGKQSQKSCGCMSKVKLKHGHSRIGHRTSEYTSWYSMIQRSHNPNHKRFYDYGGRGITVCEKWRNSFVDFLSDMGFKPSSKHTLERINNLNGYEPGNTIWALPYVQKRNMRSNRWITYNRRTLCLTDWARELGIHYNTLDQRLLHGWSIEDALTKPVKRRLFG